MTLLTILKILVAIGTAATGLLMIFRATGLESFTGLVASSPRATTEIRIFGGFFLGLGVLPLVFGLNESMFLMLGWTYLVVAVVRLIAMFVDGSQQASSNWISLATEVIGGIVLIL